MASTFVEFHDPVEGTIRVDLVETKRSPNAFMLWSRHRRSALLHSKKMAEVSQQQGAEWNDLPEEQKQPFRVAAKMAREEHKRAFPNKPYHSKSGKRSKKEKKKMEALPQPVQPHQPEAWEYSPPSVSPPGYIPQPQMMQFALDAIPQQQQPQHPAAWEYSPQSVSPPGYNPQPPNAPMQMMQYAPGPQYFNHQEGAYYYPQNPMPAEPVQHPLPEEAAQHHHPTQNPGYDEHVDDWFWGENADTSPPQQPQVYSQQGDDYNPYPQMYHYY